MKSAQNFNLTNGNKTLHIKNVTTDVSGLYSCEAKNSIGESKMDFSLDVLPSNISKSNVNESYTDNDGGSGGGDVNKNQSKTSLMIPSGASILIDCPFDHGNPEVLIFWMRISVNATEILSNEVSLVKKRSNVTCIEQ